MTRQALQEALGLSDREHFRKAYLLPAVELGMVEMTRRTNRKAVTSATD